MSAQLTVSQLNFYLRSSLEGDARLAAVTVLGEVTNFRGLQRSGSLFFSLKDDRASIDVMIPARSAAALPFLPENGMKVLAQGKVTLYEPYGRIQLAVTRLLPAGAGAQAVALDQLKARLEAEGVFDNHRPLPAFPIRIGVITSPNGAALQDIREITARRWPVARLVLAPVLVQGEKAPVQLAQAVQEMNARHAADVILIGRGGGSAEDLSAFNDEALARAVAASAIPVVSAVGHETDYTLCDYAADLRVPTPSVAAELATPDGEELAARLWELSARIRRGAQLAVQHRQRELDLLLADSPLLRPERLLEGWTRQLEHLRTRSEKSLAHRLEQEHRRLAVAAGKLDALSPLRVLSRGYAAAFTQSGQAVTDAAKLTAGETLSLRFAQGSAEVRVLQAKGEDHG